jgi:hypothetical protein
MSPKEGKCPQCGYDLKYQEGHLQDEMHYFYVSCAACYWEGKEWYLLTFSGHTTDVCGESDG